MEITITRQDLSALSEMSCIEITEHEIEPLITELRAVLTYVSSLKEVAHKYGDVVPLTKPINIVRADTAKPFNYTVLMENAPEEENNFFVVPVVVKQS